MSGLHARVFDFNAGPVDTIFTAIGLSVLAAGSYAFVNLRGIQLVQTPGGDATTGG